jgi:hypothetical protein
MNRAILTPARDRDIPTSGPQIPGSSRRRIARATTVLFATLVALPLLAVAAYAQTIPDFQPVKPAGGDALLNLGGNIKYIALIGIPAVFFAGLVCLGFGKIVDHRGAHRIGMGMALSAVGVAIAVGAGIPFLNSFAG